VKYVYPWEEIAGGIQWPKALTKMDEEELTDFLRDLRHHPADGAEYG
jgi:hypothetical protein